ncbi:leucine-rich repeat domain-containing protein [Parablautia intestinalis]|nr:leucine-rich repeat domain-containing protein [Parablautia intestinalis]
MRKYYCLCALFISLLLYACSNTADTTGKTSMEPNNPNEPTQREPLSEEIMFLSPEIEYRTRELLEKPEGAITKSDVLAITEFGFDGYEEISCEKPFLDLQWFCNLEKVNLYNCNVQSLEGVEALTALKTLWVSDNCITDITPVIRLTGLVDFHCVGNDIEDYAPVSELVHLEGLEIGNTSETEVDITFAANLTNLKALYARNCGISDISVLCSLTQLEELNLGKNRISDISPLKNMQNLTEVSLDNNNIVDISPLENKPKLMRLNLGNNLISNITPLYGLHALTYIELEGNRISDSDFNRFYEERQNDLITVMQTGKLREDMSELTFQLTAYYDLRRESYAVQTIDVYQGETQLQTISIPELTMEGQTCIDVSSQDTLGFELEDVNFDGYRDIRLFDTLNGNYRTEWIYLVWNAKEQKFENDTRLNQISLAVFDQEEQLIYGMERDGAAHHYYSTYRYIDGEIVKIHYYEEEGLVISDEQIRQYYDAASVKTDGVIFDAWYEHVMERNAVSGELETVSEEYVFNPYDSEGKSIENEEERLRVDVSSGLGAQISADVSR